MLELSETGLFADLTNSELEDAGRFVQTEKHARKQVIFTEGESPEWLYIVKEGKVKITKISHEGKELILEIIPPMEFFGGIAVYKGFPYPANAVAMEPTTLFKISRQDLLALVDKYPSIVYHITDNMGERIRVSHDSMKNIALERIETRIASLLLKFAEKSSTETEDGVLIDIKLTRQDIAEMVGTTVETSIRTMSRFKKDEMIGEKEGKILLRDIDALRKLTGTV